MTTTVVAPTIVAEIDVEVDVMCDEGGNPLEYLLCDDFTDTRTAGNVNGTSATPGPGTRTAIENDGQFTIGSGKLTVPVQSSPGWSDLGLLYNTAFPRTAGRVLLMKFNNVANSNHISMGWNDSADITGDPASWSGGAIRFGPTYILAEGYVGDMTQINIGTYAATTEYSLAFIQRTTGMYVFIKGGIYINWAMIYINSASNSANLYPALSSYNGDGTLDCVHIPDVIWLPTCLAYDTFDRADGALGNTETTGPDGTLIAEAWTDTAGTWAISTFSVVCSALSGGIGIATVDLASRNVLVQADLLVGAGNAGVVASYVDASNYIYAYHDGTNAVLKKVIGGTPTTLINEVTTYVAGKFLRVIVNGNSVIMVYNNMRVGTAQTVSDVELSTGTKCGFYTSNTGNTFDNLCVYSSNYSQLDLYSG